MKFSEAVQLVHHIESQRRERWGEWQELCDLFLPHHGRFAGSDDKRGLREKNTYNNHAARTIVESAAMLTSCSTPEGLDWFSHDFMDPSLREQTGAMEWLQTVDSIIRDALKLGGFYEAINMANEEILGVGCMLMSAMPGITKPLIYRCCTIGTYAVTLDQEGELYAVVERERWTVRDMAERFGVGRLCEGTAKSLEHSPYDEKDVIHLTMRRTERDSGKVDAANKPVASYWMEPGGEHFLAEGGFDSMPYFFAVWNSGRGIYGTGPGDLARSDQRAVETNELYKTLGLEKTIDPPIVVPASLAGKISTNPGARVTAPGATTDTLRPLYSIDFSRGVQMVQQEIQIVTERLDDTLMRNVFSVPPDELLKGMTATAVVARRRAAISKMGPAVSRIEMNILSPLIERTYRTLWNMGFLPEPPQSIVEFGAYTSVVYKSPLAEGLKQAESDSLAAFLAIAQPIIQAVPEAGDKIKWDQVLDVAARSFAVDQSCIASDEEVEQVRQARAEAQRQQQEAEQMAMAAQAASQIGGTSTEGTLAGALLNGQQQEGLNG